jgi:uncharacterized protein involved in response to NO
MLETLSAHPAGPPRPSPWRLLFAAPHRLFFLPGVIQALIAMLLWSAALAGREGLFGAAVGFSVQAIWAHAYLMLYGLFPFFIFGFLITVYPRWMNSSPIPAVHYAPSGVLFTLGQLGCDAGFFTHTALLLTGLAASLGAWLWIITVLYGVYRSAARPGLHERLLNAALLTGFVGQLLFAYGVAAQHSEAVRIAFILGLWGFLLPVVFVVAHRMIPFFGSAALANYPIVRPTTALLTATVALAAHAVLAMLERPAWSFPFDLAAAGVGFYLSWRWDLARSLAIKLLAMLHIAFLWFGLGMTLAAVQSGLLFATGQDILGRAPLHALGVGFVAGMMVAMVSRVSLGHSGRPLVADRLTWLCFLGIQATAVLRVSAEFTHHTLNLAAALLWLASLAPWARHYAPFYWRARVDGKPG